MNPAFKIAVRVSEEMTAVGIRDEIIQQSYTELDQHLGYFILKL